MLSQNTQGLSARSCPTQPMHKIIDVFEIKRVTESAPLVKSNYYFLNSTHGHFIKIQT